MPGVKFLVSQFLHLTLMQFRFRFFGECANLHLAVPQLVGCFKTRENTHCLLSFSTPFVHRTLFSTPVRGKNGAAVGQHILMAG